MDISSPLKTNCVILSAVEKYERKIKINIVIIGVMLSAPLWRHRSDSCEIAFPPL